MAKIAGNLQRIRNGQRRYAITPRIPGGFVQPSLLEKFIEVAKKFDAVLKITGAQRIMITNLKAEDVDAAWEILGMQPAYSVSNRVRSVTMCPGTTFCKRAKQDSVHLGMQLERKYTSLEMPSKMKMSVSGCPNSCTEGALKDIGVIGSVDGWSIYAGGSGGAHPRIADLIAEVETEAEVLQIVDNMVNYYKENAQIERIGEFIDRIGLETFKAAVLGDSYVAPTAEKLTKIEAEKSSTKVVQTEPSVNLPGTGNSALANDGAITKDSIVREIIDDCPETIPVLQSIGMGCLGCPSSTNEPLWKAAEIHGIDVNELVSTLEKTRRTAKGLNLEDEGAFGPGKTITKDVIIRELIEVYPNTIPLLQSIGMGCLGCPSSTSEPIWQAAEIHGIDVDDLVNQLNVVRKGA